MIDIGLLCARCTALCCRYVTVELDTPEDDSDFDEIRWFLMHENIAVYIEDGSWYVQFQTRCRNLASDNRCGIYDTRPQICREHGAKGDCEFTGDIETKVLFQNSDDFEHWVSENYEFV